MQVPPIAELRFIHGKKAWPQETDMKRDWIQKIVGPGEHQLLLDFYVAFSRFEYAMKRAGFFKQHRKGKKANLKKAKWPEPDWDTFATSIRGKFASSKDPLFKLACNYLMEQPPKTQVISNDVFEWRASGRVEGESDEQFVLRMVRKVRTNLFHGGAFPESGVTEEPARNDYLIQATLSVLEGCLRYDEKLQTAFEAP